LCYYREGYRPPSISLLLLNEGLKASRVGVAKFIARFEATGTVALHRKPGSGRPSKITAEIKEIVEEKMQEDDETTAYQLHALLLSRGCSISRRTVLRCRVQLGWTFRGSAYCQLIREVNKDKRLQWAQQYISDSFDNVIWTDECSVQLETHKCFCCRKEGAPPKPKLRYAYIIIIMYNCIL